MIFRIVMALGVLTLTASCTTLGVEPFPEPLRQPKTLPEVGGVSAGDGTGEVEEAEGLQTSPAPGVVVQRTVAEGIADRLGEDLRGEPVQVSFNGVRLGAFINEVFGELLGLSYHITPGLRDKSDLVTLRLAEPLPPSQLFATARRVLQDYGVDLSEEEGVITFTVSQQITTRDIPLLISGRTLPEVPATHRTIFQLVPLKVLRTPQVTSLLRQAFANQKISIGEDPLRNSLLLKGNADMIGRVLDMLDVLDQPLLKSRYGTIIEPEYLDAEAMGKDLQAVLEAQGYQVSVRGGLGSVTLLPLDSVNKLVAFAADRLTLDHIEMWARTLDAEQQQSIEDAVFTYQVLHTQAEEMTDTLNDIMGAGSGRRASSGDEDSAPRSVVTGGGRIVVDKNRNMLLFRGSGKEWGELLTVIDELDRPVPSVLIELVIAEVTLSDEEESGLEFFFRSGIGGGRRISGGTLEGLGLQSKALSLTLDSAGQTRALLNLFYDQSRVMIRSRPRLLVKSGQTASLEAGNEIPVVVQASDSDVQLDGTTNVLQQVSYRKTGVLLDIEPIVQANGLVDLNISQELSEAQPAATTSLDGTPTILNRRISTSLTLRDGGSLLMGGLISNSQSAGNAGVPGLGRIPGLGRLFRANSFLESRTELVVLVIPYVVSDFDEGRELTERIKSELELHERYMRDL